MKVVLFTHDGPLYMPRYLEPILEEHGDKIEEMVLAPSKRGFLEDLKIQYRMFGPKAFTIFGALYAKGKVLDQLPKSLVYEITGRYHSVRSLAGAYDVPIREEIDVNNPGFVDYLRDINPDLILSIASEQKLGEELLGIPEEGCVNVHGSLLPDYRGPSTAFWVLYHDETESGVSAHYMTPEFDAGDILIQKTFEIEDDDTMHDVYEKIINIGSEIGIQVIDDIKRGSINTMSSNTSEGGYYSFPSKKDRIQFKKRGNEYIHLSHLKWW